MGILNFADAKMRIFIGYFSFTTNNARTKIAIFNFDFRKRENAKFY